MRPSAPSAVGPGTAGFTLIEVVAALVVFSVGVLLTAGLTTALSIRMQHASMRSELVTLAREQMDAIATLPHDALPPSGVDTLQVQGRAFVRTLVVEPDDEHPRLREIRLTLQPAVPPGPRYGVITFVAEPPP